MIPAYPSWRSKPRRSRPGPLLAFVLLAGGPLAVAPLPDLHDNPRPVALDPGALATPWTRISASSGAAGTWATLEPGAGMHPTLRAKAAGEALPQPPRLGDRPGRFARLPHGGLALFWVDGDLHHGEARGPGSPGDLLARTTRLAEAARSGDWIRYAEAGTPEDAIEIEFSGISARVRITGGGEAEARRETLRQARSLGTECPHWDPLPGLPGPAFAASRRHCAPQAFVVAGRVLITAYGEKPEHVLPRFSATLHRPFPPPPGEPPRIDR